MKFIPALTASFLTLAAASAQDTLRQAGEGRVFLKTPADQPPITGVGVTLGSVTDALWEKDPAKSARQKDIRFGIRSWEWQEIRISFTPGKVAYSRAHIASAMAAGAPPSASEA